MEREQTTIRLPAELKEQLQQEAEWGNKSYEEYKEMKINAFHATVPYIAILIGWIFGFFVLIVLAVIY